MNIELAISIVGTLAGLAAVLAAWRALPGPADRAEPDMRRVEAFIASASRERLRAVTAPRS